MKDLKIVTMFTMKEMLKRKSFVITTIIVILLIVIGFNIPNIINFFNKDNNIGEEKLLIVDSENLFEGALNTLDSMNLGYQINVVNQDLTFEEIKTKIEQKEISKAIIIDKNLENDTYKLRYIVENMATISNIPENLINAVNSIYTNLQISKLGLTPEQLDTITPNFEYSIEQTEEQEVSGNVTVIMLLSLVLFYAIYFCAYQVSSSITTEKTSKIMETLVTSTTPRTIVIGKTIGIGIIGLVQVCLFVTVALISAKLFLEPGILDNVLDMSKFTPYLARV